MSGCILYSWTTQRWLLSPPKGLICAFLYSHCRLISLLFGKIGWLKDNCRHHFTVYLLPWSNCCRFTLRQSEHGFNLILWHFAHAPKPPRAIVLRPHWQYSIKRYGTRHSRNWCDGSPCAAPILSLLLPLLQQSTLSICVLSSWKWDTRKTALHRSTKTTCLLSIWSVTMSRLNALVILIFNILPSKIGPKPKIFFVTYFAYIIDSRKNFSGRSIPAPICSTVDNLHSLKPIWILGEGVDQPVHWCLDTLHRHCTRYTDRPYGGMLPNNINRISSLFY